MTRYVAVLTEDRDRALEEVRATRRRLEDSEAEALSLRGRIKRAEETIEYLREGTRQGRGGGGPFSYAFSALSLPDPSSDALASSAVGAVALKSHPSRDRAAAAAQSPSLFGNPGGGSRSVRPPSMSTLAPGAGGGPPSNAHRRPLVGGGWRDDSLWGAAGRREGAGGGNRRF